MKAMNMPISNQKKSLSFSIEGINRITKAFWSLNGELNPANKVTFQRLIDATKMDEVRSHFEKTDQIKPSYTALVMKAAALALVEYPYANRALIGLPFFKKMVSFHNMDITVAIEMDIEGAEQHLVLADTVPEVTKKTLSEITVVLKSIGDKKGQNSQRWHLFESILTKFPVCISKWIIRMPSFSPRLWVKHRGNACLVNSPAKYGIDAIVVDQLWPLTVSFGWVKKRPMVVDNEIVAKNTMPLFIIFDRRIMAGAPAARFFNRLAEILENADRELR